MRKVLKFLQNTKEVLTTAGAVLAAAIVAVETYQALKRKIDDASRS
jgi:biopolymer transport protein ExbB/TolQ